MNHLDLWSLVRIVGPILFVCALSGWILRLAQKHPSGARGSWKTVGKIAITVICGAAMAVGGCFGFLAQMNKGNHHQSIFLVLGFLD